MYCKAADVTMRAESKKGYDMARSLEKFQQELATHVT